MDGSVTGDQVTTPATISQDKTTVTFHVRLSQPGEGYAFTVDAVNAGTMNAEIDNMIFKVNGVENAGLPNYLDVMMVSLGDSIGPVQEGDTLLAGETKTIGVSYVYNKDINANQLPSTSESFDITIGVVYKQTETSYSQLYSFSNTNFAIGNPLPNGVTTFDSYQEVINNSGINVFVKYDFTNDLLSNRSVGFIYNGNVYYINSNGTNTCDYDEMADFLDNVFGQSNCEEDTEVVGIDFNKRIYTCFNSDIFAKVKETCSVLVHNNDNYGCYVNGDTVTCGIFNTNI